MAPLSKTLLVLALALCLPAWAQEGSPGKGNKPSPEEKARAWFTDTVLLTQEGKRSGSTATS